MLSLVTDRQVKFHLIRCVSIYNINIYKSAPNMERTDDCINMNQFLIRLCFNSYLTLNTYTRWSALKPCKHTLCTVHLSHTGWASPSFNQQHCRNCKKSQTCFSALVLADSSCASTISRSAVICTLSLSASSSSSILSSFLRRLSWKTTEDQVKETN